MHIYFYMSLQFAFSPQHSLNRDISNFYCCKSIPKNLAI